MTAVAIRVRPVDTEREATLRGTVRAARIMGALDHHLGSPLGEPLYLGPVAMAAYRHGRDHAGRECCTALR